MSLDVRAALMAQVYQTAIANVIVGVVTTLRYQLLMTGSILKPSVHTVT